MREKNQSLFYAFHFLSIVIHSVLFVSNTNTVMGSYTLSSVYKQPKELTTSLCCLNFSKIWLVLLLIRCLNFVMSITLKSFKKQFSCQIKLGIHREFMKNKTRMHIIIAFSSKLGGSAEWQQRNLWFLKKILLSSKKLN